MTVITARDVRDADQEPLPGDQQLADCLESERARATTEPPLRADGCGERDLPPVDVGDHVQDRDDTDATMVVVNLDTLRADAYELETDGPTVADVNQEYSATDDVVEVIYPSRTDLELEGKKRYAFPRARLEVVARVHDRDGDQEVSE